MSPYNHLTLKDRECILLGVTLNDTYQVIAEKIGCSKATVSREIKRNGGRKAYSAVKAQENYQGRRLKSRRPRLLTDLKLRDFVLHCIVQRQWSPEQISGRLVHENSEWHVSYNTIYRGIERDNLGIKRKNHEARGFARKLRHRGKTRKVKGTIKERPVSCENRSWFGHWESDTVRGKTGRSALVTLVDRKSRYLLSQRVPKVNAKNVTQAMIDLLHTVTPKRVRTLTPDRGTEFAGYREVSQELSIPVYFPDPHASQQRGTNENTNGLIREYFPKGTDLDQLTDQDIDKFVRDLNHQPRKVLSWKSPFEVFFGTKLRLI
ncbi:IS30 family transposase [Lactiplantibacillus plantarum]|jgi:transposase, IS30 family|uniref:IS30 family transposase n=1 Tax=Lactiplantibacillus plantarum TaxID=1590 RepID=UPI00137BC9A8|nr:IS30 family transposase [Lactiplantibacillus plantarum]MBO2710771.1 IS30 family transposase [Lactiplantibacillus plantarum]MBS0939867.1 IS30 family transposase [Lactiplantibacillus plantarum]MCG0569371.1 transposase-like protein [Lactiplantibacillus plantarum]MCG0615681.1 transposase-like protein [Lactiplantibacillus plantarum]MCG0629533.1 transposase-like protein [Lactiplantibacillus plantarum]